MKLEEEEDSDLCLFRVDGTVIPNLDVEVDEVLDFGEVPEESRED